MARNPVDPEKKARNRAKQRAKESRDAGRLASPDYMEEGRFGVVKVRCKCGDVLQELRPVAHLSETKHENGRTIIRERLAMFTNASYTELEITFDDGSKHITPSCRGCLPGLNLQKIEDIYSADMDRWDKEEDRGMGKVHWRLSADRLPVSWKEVPATERFKD